MHGQRENTGHVTQFKRGFAPTGIQHVISNMVTKRVLMRKRCQSL